MELTNAKCCFFKNKAGSDVYDGSIFLGVSNSFSKLSCLLVSDSFCTDGESLVGCNVQKTVAISSAI